MYMKYPISINASVLVCPFFVYAVEVWSRTLAEVALNDTFHRRAFGNLAVHDIVNSQPFTEVEKQSEEQTEANAAQALQQARQSKLCQHV